MRGISNSVPLRVPTINIGAIIRLYYPNDARNRSKRFLEVDLIVTDLTDLKNVIWTYNKFGKDSQDIIIPEVDTSVVVGEDRICRKPNKNGVLEIIGSIDEIEGDLVVVEFVPSVNQFVVTRSLPRFNQNWYANYPQRTDGLLRRIIHKGTQVDYKDSGAIEITRGNTEIKLNSNETIDIVCNTAQINITNDAIKTTLNNQSTIEMTQTAIMLTVQNGNLYLNVAGAAYPIARANCPSDNVLGIPVSGGNPKTLG